MKLDAARFAGEVPQADKCASELSVGTLGDPARLPPEIHLLMHALRHWDRVAVCGYETPALLAAVHRLLRQRKATACHAPCSTGTRPQSA